MNFFVESEHARTWHASHSRDPRLYLALLYIDEFAVLKVGISGVLSRRFKRITTTRDNPWGIRASCGVLLESFRFRSIDDARSVECSITSTIKSSLPAICRWTPSIVPAVPMNTDAGPCFPSGEWMFMAKEVSNRGFALFDRFNSLCPAAFRIKELQ